jgi:hypothetical protein
VLERVSEHPLVCPADLAALLRVSVARTSHVISALAAQGLTSPIGRHPKRYALTRAGVEILAAREGLSMQSYVRLHGIALDEEGQPAFSRLVKYLPHDVGAMAFFLMLLRRAAWRRGAGHDDRLAEWEGPARCQRRFLLDGRWRSLRPDGFGVYVADGQPHAFHLEWDRGTLRPSQQRRKLLAYRAYDEAAGWAGDRSKCPTLLFIFSDPGCEDRTLRSAAEVLRDGTMPVLTTTRAMLIRYGPAARIWRSPFESGRQCWLGQPTRLALAAKAA